MDPKVDLLSHAHHGASPQGAMTLGTPVFTPVMPCGTGPQPQLVQNTGIRCVLEKHPEQKQLPVVIIAAEQPTSQQTTRESPGQSPQLSTSQPLNIAPIPLCPSPMTPISPHVPISESSQIVPQLQNIVCSVNLSCKLDLHTIALSARNAEYNPKRFTAVVMRIREPRTTSLLFSSGKMVCTGAKSEEQCRLAARKHARVVQKLGFPAKFLDFKIHNLVATCDVMFPIRLESLVMTQPQFSTYEPELFPGLVYRMIKPKIVLLIFGSGKIVLTGAKAREELHQAFDSIYPILKAFRKTTGGLQRSPVSTPI